MPPRRRRRLQWLPRPEIELERQPDAVPKRGLFVEPVRLTRLEALHVEPCDDGQVQVTFLAEVKDAVDQRCSNVAVEAEVVGPHRSAVAHATTDLLGRIRVKMTGPVGHYALTIRDVAAGGLDWDPDAGPISTEVTAAASPG